LFLQARYLHEQPAGDSFLRAFDYYKAALEIDDTYVPAWVWLAALYDDTINSSGLPYEEVGRLAHEAIDTALRIDPDDPMALGMSALILADWDGNIRTAVERMKRALELDPNNAILLRWAANLSPSLGLYEQAVRINEYLYERDPVGNIARINLAGSYINAGRFQEGIELCEIHLAVNADDSPCRYRITIGYLYRGDAVSALEHLNLLESETGRLRLAPMVFFALGKPEWRESLGELLRRYENRETRWATQIARVYAFAGEIDAAFAWLETARADDMLDVSPDSIHFRNLQTDPRWSELMETLGLTPEAIAEIGFTVRVPE
jgi:tetratricopeptide (TPR) repeat protein